MVRLSIQTSLAALLELCQPKFTSTNIPFIQFAGRRQIRRFGVLDVRPMADAGRLPRRRSKASLLFPSRSTRT
jgi:hypothetical protein